MQKAGRNDPCPCGSGKKYKVCCGAPQQAGPSPAMLATLANTGSEHLRAGRIRDAEAILRQLQQAAPQAPATLRLGGLLAFMQGNHAAAIAQLSSVAAAEPKDPLCRFHLGLAYQHSGAFDQAIASYRQSLQIEPRQPHVQHNLGAAFAADGRLGEAVEAYGRAIALNPGYAETHNALGLVLKAQGRLDEAAAAFRQAATLDGRHLEARCYLASTLIAQGKPDEAVAACRDAIALAPNHALAHRLLGSALSAQGRYHEAVDSLQAAIRLQPDAAASHDDLLFAMQFDPKRTQSAIREAGERYARQFEQALRPWLPHSNERNPNRRLRIGYVSPDFRRHAVAYFIEPILARHDRCEVEVFCYYNNAREDAFTERLRALSDHWTDVHGMNDEQLAGYIRLDEIDILVDLAGHTVGNRLLAFARKPAPVQMTYFGSPGSSWLTSMDYRLTDAITDPEGAESDYREALLHLPDSLWCYQPHAAMPEVGPLPALARGHVTFGSFASFKKIDARSIELWAKLLLAVPNSRLLMATVPEGQSRDVLLARLAAQGIGPERVALHGMLAGDDFQRLYLQADIALDPLAINSPTILCEALWMGLPTVSLAGDDAAARTGASILHAAGLPECVACDEDGYLAQACRLAADLPALAALRAGLRERLLHSPLMDADRFTRNLEACYRQAWKQWCHTHMPATAAIEAE